MRITDVGGLITSVISDWKGIVINPHFIRFGSTISWTKKPQFLDQPILVSDVLDMIDNRQYSYQVTEDDLVTGIIQLHYSYERAGKTIVSASLGFYSTKPFIDLNIRNTISTNAGENESETLVQEQVDEAEYPAYWMRIDYAPGESSDVIHHSCHMHISGLPDTRFMVRGLPNPRQFVELVMASFYPEIYKKHRLDPQQQHRVLSDFAPFSSINEKCISHSDTPVFRNVAHFSIPTQSSR